MCGTAASNVCGLFGLVVRARCIDERDAVNVEVLADEKGDHRDRYFLRRAVAQLRRARITMRLITENGRPPFVHRDAIVRPQPRHRHLTTRLHRRETNGKAERFIRMLSRWAGRRDDRWK